MSYYIDYVKLLENKDFELCDNYDIAVTDNNQRLVLLTEMSVPYDCHI